MANRMLRLAGFTLVELMIAVVIIGTLSAIAIPIYSQQVRKSHRTDTQTSMMELSVRQTSWRSNHTSYGTMGDVTGLSPAIADPSDSYYNVTIAAGASTYTITATPQGSQALDSCGTMTLNQSLVGTPADCW